ncbi:hypothetical protein SD70_27685 [Gordoniibacillus kamchatkensis]|uniref:HNH endonuclease n=1 Tax=Gordoniibacillus kamchatkensis TaxID=1590651 RepID=A0ABR5AB02_9BACL|nr:hypothetical protein SD70_27685 [Paenibacillus sp. VKM B-2647]
MTQFAYNPYSKQTQLARTRIKPTQRQMGYISPKVRKQVRTRSGGICEVRKRCKGAPAVQQAHITGRKQLTHRTTAADLLDSCLECHKWLDETESGIRYKKQLRQVSQ